MALMGCAALLVQGNARVFLKPTDCEHAAYETSPIEYSIDWPRCDALDGKLTSRRALPMLPAGAMPLNTGTQSMGDQSCGVQTLPRRQAPRDKL